MQFTISLCNLQRVCYGDTSFTAPTSPLSKRGAAALARAHAVGGGHANNNDAAVSWIGLAAALAGMGRRGAVPGIAARARHAEVARRSTALRRAHHGVEHTGGGASFS